MIFSRTYRYSTATSSDDIKKRLIGKHVKIHNMDFEVFEKDNNLRIIPHAEQEEHIKTLPITHVDFKANGKNNQVTINCKMRKIDSGGPLLIVIFCMFLLIAGVLFFVVGKKEFLTFTYTLVGISLGIFIVFWLKMESGYFDYVRKIRDYIKKEGGI